MLQSTVEAATQSMTVHLLVQGHTSLVTRCFSYHIPAGSYRYSCHSKLYYSRNFRILFYKSNFSSFEEALYVYLLVIICCSEQEWHSCFMCAEVWLYVHAEVQE